MATPEPATEITPLEYMKKADEQWAAGNQRYAAALLWKAAEATFISLAQERGLDLDKLHQDYMAEISLTWKRAFAKSQPPIDYTGDADPAWNLDLRKPTGLIPLAKALEEDHVAPKPSYMSYSGFLTTAFLLHDHALMDVVEDYELEYAYEDARKCLVGFHGEPA